MTPWAVQIDKYAGYFGPMPHPKNFRVRALGEIAIRCSDMSAMVAFFIAIVALAPNSMDMKDSFKPGKAVLLLQVAIFVFSVMMISKASEFLYFQF